MSRSPQQAGPAAPSADTAARSALAVALAYRTGDLAPRVVAQGRGVIAETIIERAREAGVYVHESPELVALLMQVDLDQRIPPQLYIAVAEVLAWLYRIERGDKDPGPLPGCGPDTEGSTGKRAGSASGSAPRLSAPSTQPAGPPPSEAPPVR